MDVSVGFSDDSFCAADFTAVWTAPEDCYDPCAPETTLLGVLQRLPTSGRME